MKFKSLINKIIANWPVKILAFVAAVLLFNFNAMQILRKETINVPLSIIKADGLTIGRNYPKIVSCEIEGENEEYISNISPEEFMKDFMIYIDLSNITQPGEINVPVNIKRNEVLELYGVSVKSFSPTELSIYLEEEVTKTLPVIANQKGFPARGYTLEYILEPSLVRLSGPKTLMESISEVYTEEINISGRALDFITTLNVSSPDSLISITGNDQVEFYGIIKETIITKIFENVPIKIVNKDPEMIVDDIDLEGQIKLQGPELLLEDFESLDISLNLDLRGITVPSVYTIELIPNVPPGTEIVDYQPKEIPVFVKREYKSFR